MSESSVPVKLNPLVEQILEALKERKDGEILKFGALKIVKNINHGQQGIVVKAQNPNGKFYGIKFYAPSDKNPSLLQRAKTMFMREAKILVKLRHRNIVGAHAYGSATFDKKWKIHWGFSKQGKTLYYVMDFVEGESARKLFFTKCDDNIKKYVADFSKGSNLNLDLFEQFILQVSDAMGFFHKAGIVHRDIKPDNVIYSPTDNAFIVIDFGFGKDFGEGEKEGSNGEIIVRRRYLDKDTEEKSPEEDHLLDQFFFAAMLSEILPIFKPIYTRWNYNGIRSVLEKAMGERNQRYADMEEFRAAITSFLFICSYSNYEFHVGSFLIPSLRFSFFDRQMRIPVSGSIPISKELTRIIDTKDFQRLKGVRQLGPTFFVYPGATHTRFEHSLGTYALSLKYLEVLLRNEEFFKAIDDVDETIKLVALAALLHDIGHYPYSHWIEEIDGLPEDLNLVSHETRVRKIIMGNKIGEIIKEQWNVKPELVCQIIKGHRLQGREELIKSILDSAIDVDRVDYLQRDSAHCGVPYGSAFDAERLISSLWFNEKVNSICLTEKARSTFTALVTSNVVMFQVVYWHKTVRACEAMFKRFFYEFVRKESVDYKTISEYLTYSDDRFVQKLYVKSKKDQNLSKLISPFAFQGRELYKPAFVHNPEHGKVHANTAHFFKTLARQSYPEQVRSANILAERLKKSFPTIEENDILLESTPVKFDHEMPKLIGFEFFDQILERFEPPTNEISNLNSYLELNRRSFIFCKPKHYEDIRAIARNGKLNEILGDVNQEVDVKSKH